MDWTRGRAIGHGASSSAVSVAASLHAGGDVFAVKSIELSRSELLQRESKILSAMDDDHIIGYKGCDITQEDGAAVFNLKMEYAPRGTLADAVRRPGGGLDEPTLRHYTRQIVRGLEYLHSEGIVHCDIKGSNVLVTEGGAKIADFGCAKAAGKAAIGGTPMYMAPEVARGEEQEYPADVWALGCTVIEMSTGKAPWPNTPAALHRIAFSGQSPEFPAPLSDTGKDFLNKCLRVDPKERWTAKELLKHPFLDEVRILNSTDSTESPTSILDGGVWGSMGEESIDVEGEDWWDCPKQRMQELWTKSRREWEWDDSWVTVRDNSENVNNRLGTEGWVLENFQFF